MYLARIEFRIALKASYTVELRYYSLTIWGIKYCLKMISESVVLCCYLLYSVQMFA